MTKLKVSINFNSNCILSVKDTTGFGGAEGFLTQSSSPTLEGNYKLTDGYFINAVMFHKYNTDIQYTNQTDEMEHILSNDVKPVYADNFVTTNYKLPADGVYTFKRIFVISKEYYNANYPEITKAVIYYDSDEDKFFTIEGGEPVEITKAEVVNNVDTSYTGSSITYKFVSTCNLKRSRSLLGR